MKVGAVFLVVAAHLLHCNVARYAKRSEHLSNAQLVEKFNEIKDQFNQSMPTSTEQIERLKQFNTTAQQIEDHNNNDGDMYEENFNKFSTMTDEERAAYLGGVTNGSESESALIKRFFSKRDAVWDSSNPDSVDWSDYLPSVKYQEGCPSCWAFGAIAPLEYQVNRRSKDNVGVLSFSEQQYVNCVYGTDDGCSGSGDAWKCWEWNSENSIATGMPSTADVPYTASGYETCDTSKDNAMYGLKILGAKELVDDGDAALENAVATSTIGVLVTNIAVVSSLWSYESGIYSESDCTSVNHAVVVVGYGVSGGVGWFRIRNSWDDDWGENGYARFERGLSGANINTCLVSKEARYPRVSGALAADPSNWCEYEDKYLNGYESSDTYKFDTFAEAAVQCLKRSTLDKECKGIVYEAGTSQKYTLRTGKKKKDSNTGEILWKDCDDAFFI